MRAESRPNMSRTQLNVRISEELEKAIDAKRIELHPILGEIPSRSDVLRMALEAYLGLPLSEIEADRRSTTGPDTRKAQSAEPTKSKTGSAPSRSTPR